MELESEVIRVTLKLKSIPVEVEAEDGTVKNYTMREMNGTARDAHMKSMSDRVKFDPATGKPTGLKTFDNLQSGLLARVMFDEEGKPVDNKTIQTWPSSTQTVLFKAAQKLNAMDEKDEGKEELKND